MKLWFTCLFAGLFLALTAHGQTAPEAKVRFQMLDVYVDAGDQPLAAYQAEIAVERGQAKIAGIEGGAHPAYKEPPFYDPKAMQQERVIIAAFNTGAAAKLPTGKVRVATLHVQVIGSETPEFAVKLRTAGTTGARKIAARATLEERNAQ